MPPLAVAFGALALALGAGASAGTAATPDPLVTPAPPPALFCRAAPDGTWPAIGQGLIPDLTPFQDYRAGLDIPAGATGAGVRVADVEYEWSATHVDLQARGLPAAAATSLGSKYPDVRDHGTAVLGILGATDDGQGVTGLVPGAQLLPVSPMYAPLQAYRPAKAIDDAAAPLVAGDVLLIEQQSQIATGVYGPIEYFDSVSNPVRTSIAKAVARGIVVVEPAGNGGLDIGTLAGAPWLSGTAGASSSGALIVGAGGSGTGPADVPDRQRVPGSNWGARVDVQGFGTALVSLGYGDISVGADEDHEYTACFDGTSSASATVAGAVAALQSRAIADRGTPLTPAEVRSVLRSTGLAQVPTPGVDVSTENIGPRPQISAALAALPIGPPPSVGAGTVTSPIGTATVTLPAPVRPRATVSGSRPPAASRLVARFDRRLHRLTVRVKGATAAVVVRVGGRRLTVRNGRFQLHGVHAGSLVVRVTRARYRSVAFSLVVSARGAVRVVRLD